MSTATFLITMITATKITITTGFRPQGLPFASVPPILDLVSNDFPKHHVFYPSFTFVYERSFNTFLWIILISLHIMRYFKKKCFFQTC